MNASIASAEVDPAFATSLGFCEAEPFDCPAQLVRGHPRVPLRRIEMLVSEELLNLPEVAPGAKQLRYEDVAESMRVTRVRSVTPAARA